MANVLRALDTSNAWSSDDSDEEMHFREMVQLSIQARRLEPKGTGDDAVDEDDTNVRAARENVSDSPDDVVVDDDGDDDADARGDAAWESPAARGDRDVSVDSPPAERAGSFCDGCGSTRSLTDVLASMSAAPAMEPAAPELVAALAALGIDVADDGKRRRATGRDAGVSHGASLRGARSRPAVAAARDPPGFARPARTGGGYDVRAPGSGRSAPGTRRPRDGETVLARPKPKPTRFTIRAREVVCSGRLTDAEHYGYWAHAWWSDDDADAVASVMSSVASAPAPPTPFPLGFTTRVVLRPEPDPPEPRRRAFGGRVAARGEDARRDATRDRVVECSVRARRAGRPWEGPEFAIGLVASKGVGSKRKEDARAKETRFVGATPRAAVAGFARALARLEPSLFGRGAGGGRLPDAESLFGFKSRAVLDALAVRAAAAGRAVTRLRPPHGIGLVTLRVDAPAFGAPRRRGEGVGDALEKEPPRPVAEWRSARGAFPLLPGWRVTFALCAGTAAACEIVRSPDAPAGVAFAVSVRDGGAVTRRVSSRCPDRAWAKLREARRALIASGALDARLALDGTEAFLGAHLFGLESPVASRVAAQSERAAASGDAFLLAEPFLRDVYGGATKERGDAARGAPGAAEYL